MKIAVVGASSELGRRILRRLYDVEWVEVAGTSRVASKLDEFLQHEWPPEIIELDLTNITDAVEKLKDFERVVFCPILTVSAPVAMALRQAGSEAKFVFFSSNNVALDFDSEVYARIRNAEADIGALSGEWAMVRPTMIYGTPGDGTIGRLVQFALKKGVVPMIGKGQAVQQPIHYDDLTDLAVTLALKWELPNLRIGAAGSEPVTIANLNKKIVAWSGAKARVISAPTALMKMMVGLFGKVGPVTGDMVQRADVDRLPTWPPLVDWKPKISLEEGVKKIVADVKAGMAK